MQRVLVTGATGFIGRHLVATLRDQACHVTCLVRESSNRAHLEEAGCTFLFGELVEPVSLTAAIRDAEPDQVYHLAGATKAIDKKSLYRVNQQGTRNLLNALRETKRKPTTVLVSSLAAGGPSKVHRPLREIDEPRPVSDYGRSKLAAEQEAIRFADELPMSIVRPPIVLGPYDRDGLEMYKSISRIGIHPVPTFRDFSVSWIAVEDLCDALIAVMTTGARLTATTSDQGVYYATSPEMVDYGQLGKMIGASLGRKRTRAISTASSMVWLIAAANELLSRVHGRPNIMNFDKAREAVAGSWICQGDKLTDDTGFICQKGLKSTLQNLSEWYRDAGWI